jgi:hypothetical protein
MNKLNRQQAAFKEQQALEVAAEEARLARLETYIDVELQRINQEDAQEQRYLARRAETKRVIAAWEEVEANSKLDF